MRLMMMHWLDGRNWKRWKATSHDQKLTWLLDTGVSTV
jgi:hypothetical protein